MFLRRFSHTIAPISPDLFLFINNNFFKRRPIQKMEMRKNRNLKKNLIYFSTKIFVPLFLMVMLDPTLGKMASTTLDFCFYIRNHCRGIMPQAKHCWRGHEPNPRRCRPSSVANDSSGSRTHISLSNRGGRSLETGAWQIHSIQFRLSRQVSRCASTHHIQTNSSKWLVSTNSSKWLVLQSIHIWSPRGSLNTIL